MNRASSSSFGSGLILLLLIVLHSAAMSGPPEILWENDYTTGFDCRFWGVDCTDDGGAVCVGETSSEDEEIYSLMLVKFTPQGLLQWDTITGWGLSSSGQDVLQVPGGYIVCGSIYSGEGYDGFVAKFDYFGEILWCSRFENPADDVLYDVAFAGDSAYVAAGYTESIGAGLKDAWLVKIDSQGDLLWSRAYGTSGSEVAYAVAPLSQGGYALAGGSEGNFYIVTTDEEGHGTSFQTYDHEGHETARSLIASREGGFFLAGSTMESGGYQADIWLVRANTSGEEIWSMEAGGEGNDSAWDVAEPETGGYIILGNRMSAENGSYDAVVYRIDHWGNTIWEVQAGDSLWNTGSGLAMDQLGSLFFAGRTEDPVTGLFSAWVVHTGPEDLMNW